jgi:antitoxin CptB
MVEHSSLTDKQKRLIYRANHRGTKEMDWLMGKFVETNVALMDENKVDHVDELLKLAEPEIEAWLMGKSSDYPEEFDDLIKEIQMFHKL